MRGLGLVLLAAMAALAGCGGRPGPLRAFADGGTGGPADAAGDARADARADAGHDAQRDGPPQADAGPLPTCALAAAGAPLELLSYAGTSVYSPSLAALEPGGVGAPARVAIQAIVTAGDPGHPYDEVARVAVGTDWPDGVTVDVAPQPCGTESHSYAQLTRAPGGRAELALAWLGDPGGQVEVLFRTIALASFACGPTVTVSTSGSTPWGLVAGAGVGAGGQGYAGDGYGIVWEEIAQDGNESLRQPVVVVLDPAGGVILPAVPVAAAVPYPDFAERTPSLVWSGASYLLATAFDACAADDPLCVDKAVVVTRLRPEGAASRVEITATIPVLKAGTWPQRPAIAHDERGTFLVWAELAGDLWPPTIRGATLDAQGGLAGPVQLIAAAAAATGGVRVAATALGRVAVWPEDGPPGLADSELGRSRLVFQVLDELLAPRGEPARLDATLFSSHNLQPTVALGQPRGLLHSWSARSQEGDREAAFIGLLRCEPAE